MAKLSEKPKRGLDTFVVWYLVKSYVNGVDAVLKQIHITPGDDEVIDIA